METVITAQRWLYAGIANGLGEFGKGDPRAIFAVALAYDCNGVITLGSEDEGSDIGRVRSPRMVIGQVKDGYFDVAAIRRSNTF